MRGVRSLEFRYLDDQGEWRTDWPSPATSSASEEVRQRLRPRAIEFTLNTDQHGAIRRIIEVPQ